MNARERSRARQIFFSSLILIACRIGLTPLVAHAESTVSEERIYAKAVNSDQLSMQIGKADSPMVELVLNGEKDRVGAIFKKCTWEVGGDSPLCDELLFLMPELRFESNSKTIRLGEKVVATLGSGGIIHLSKDYKMGYQITPKTVDVGFDRRDASSVEVFLEKK